MILPVMAFRVVRKFVYQFSKDAKEIKDLKDKYRGRRCFILGNGPSLTVKDIALVSNEITFATNRIYSIFKHTNWRPSFYLAIDNNVLKDNLEDIMQVEAGHKFINVTAKAYGYQENEDTTFINMFGPYLVRPYAYKTKKVGRDVSKSFTYSYSVTGVAIELSIYMGFKEIYLLGVDNSYSTYIDANGIIHKDPSIKNYFGDLKTKSYTINYKDATDSYYEAFKKYCDNKDIVIKNVTRGGKLEVFERDSLEKVVK